MNRDREDYDLIVIGGGPGGATAATFVAMQGHRVLLLDKESFPAYKIGESLLPSTVHGICTMLGVSDELKRAKFICKQGGTFRWGRKREPWTFTFAQSSSIQGPTAYAYQVERMRFDQILLNNARRKGVDVRERHNVTDAVIDDGRVVGVEFVGNTGERRVARSRYVLDASGNSSTMARHVGDRVYSQFFRNVAVFGYYHGGKRLPAPCSGNIFTVAFDKGWFWYIPLSDTLTSVGAVIGVEHAQILKAGHELALQELISACEPVRELLREATRVIEGPYGEIRVRKDYSYSCTKFWRPGLVLVGDAACFIDPLFSSGVHLATYSGLLAARSINSYLSNLVEEDSAFGEFENRYRREYRYFYDFLVAFYDMDQSEEAYYWSARKVTSSEERGNEAFIRLVAGIAGSGEKLYPTASEFMHSREGISEDLFPEAQGRSSAKGDEFMGQFLTETVQMQVQAVLKNIPRHEQPLFSGGLVPSVDGFHWVEPKRPTAAVRRSS